MASEGSAPAVVANGSEESVAQRLQQHHVTVEDAPDDELSTQAADDASSAPAPGPSVVKAPAKRQQAALDTQSRELFPELGAPRGKSPNVAPIWGARSDANGGSNGVSPSSTPASGSATPAPLVSRPDVRIPGQSKERIMLHPGLIRSKLDRPLESITSDLGAKYHVTMQSTTVDGQRVFTATGPQAAAQQALRDLVAQIGSKAVIQVPIPQSTRAFIIGKGGATIKSIQERTGAKIQMPKADADQPVDKQDDEAIVLVTVEGNAISAAAAEREIEKIVNERSANVQTRVQGVPTAFYPFIAGPGHSWAHEIEQANGIQIRVPTNQLYSSAPLPVAPAAGQPPVFAPAGEDEEHIQLAGDRKAVQRVRELIARRVAELQRELEAEQLSIQRGRHQFIIGQRGIPLEDFFRETGCTIVFPQEEDDDMITVVGPPSKVQAGIDRAMDLAMGMQMSNIDISRSHRNAPGGAMAHAANVTRYLRQRKEIERLEKQYNTHINTPISQDGALPWELYSREGKNAIRAQSEITAILHGHPPSRMQTVAVDPFFHQHLRNEITPKVKKEFGVHVVVPDASEANVPVLLVFEGPDPAEGAYQPPRVKPSEAELQHFRQALEAAQKHILGLINKQEAIIAVSLDVPAKFHEKLRRFIKKEQESRDESQIPVRVTKAGNIVTLRGPKSAVESLASKATAFIEQEKIDEKERGYTLTFDFPQKFANHLIGKGGSNIKELRDRFDVEIQVQDGKVELKGPQAKAEKARSYIQNLGRTLADETTHILKIDPKYHRELIGAQGSQINRLQTRYKVLIFFPKSAKNGDDQASEAASEAGKPRRQQAPDEVIIRGPKKGADEARDEIYSLHKYLEENSHTATVGVQQKQVGSLIGQGGAALDELRQLTGARIDVPADRDTPIVEISIKGTAAQVKKAKQILEEKRAEFDDTVVQTIEVDKKHHKALIGAGGSNLRDIVTGAGGSDDRRALARTIQFPKQESDGNTIKIEGRTEVVHNIIKKIQEIVAERESQVTEVVDVPIDQHRSLIGRGGDAKRQLETQFGVSIDIPRQGDGKTGVKVSGRAENVAKAKEHISGLIKQQHSETLQIPRNLHHVVSNGGQIFRQLRNNHQVTVDHAGQSIPAKPTSSARAVEGALPLITDDADAAADVHSWKVVSLESGEEGEIPWILRGTPENVAKAKELILKNQAQAKANDATGYLILPDPRTYRFVIGPNGSKVKSIRSQSNCQIQVPRDQAKDEAIEILGTREGVEKAKDLILAAVREGQSKSRD
ncbi:Vigilin 1 [Trichoderma ghanense]|uniref:Vigilin 1 n=1 Tax=Trichoderma ghanense TaxID=65468 RepID=A0ABY2GX54_9HYPO